MRALVYASSFIACFAMLAANAACPGATRMKIGPTFVASFPDRLFFRLSELALDFDGSPIAYGTKDQGQENICVGLAPNSGICRGKFRTPCYTTCQQTFAFWSRNSGKVETIPNTMCSVGLGGSSCSKPNVHLQDPPHADYFVSETSLKTSPGNGQLLPGWGLKQAAQLDPAVIHYLVAPRALTRMGVNFGDVGVAYNVANEAEVRFIVGDGGGLGEGSVSILAALRPKKPPKLEPGVSALGERLMRYKSGIAGDFRFVIFPSTASLAPGTRNVTSDPASGLPAWIESTAGHALQTKSSRAEVLACSE
jgi:hypothetical protein